MKASRLQSAIGLLLRPSIATPSVRAAAAIPVPIQQTRRWAHNNKGAPTPAIPPTLPFVPDVETFLTLIGRGLRQHATKFPSWEALFSLSSEQLRELGIEPPRTRRYLLRWRERYAEGSYGVGGDLKHVEDGAAQLAVREFAEDPLNIRRVVVNVPTGQKADDIPAEDLVRVKGFKVKGVRTIAGSYALPAKEGGAMLKVTEGMWEDRRGHKVDGGERRRAEVRFKRRVAERKVERERFGL